MGNTKIAMSNIRFSRISYKLSRAAVKFNRVRLIRKRISSCVCFIFPIFIEKERAC